MTSVDSRTADTMLTRARRRWTLATVATVIAALTAAACGGDGGVEPLRTYDVLLHIDDSAPEYEYVADEAFDIAVGDRVTFRIANTGHLPHDVQVVDPDGNQIAAGPIAEPGSTTEVVVTFEQPGIYQLNCLVGDHLTAHGMQALVLAEAAPT